MSVRGSWSRSGVETHRQMLKEHFDNDRFVTIEMWRTISPLICQSSFLFLYPVSRPHYPAMFTRKLTTQWVFPQLPVNTTKCNFESCTQLSSRWLNQESRPGTPDAAVRSKTFLSVSRQPRVKRKIFCWFFAPTGAQILLNDFSFRMTWRA